MRKRTKTYHQIFKVPLTFLERRSVSWFTIDVEIINRQKKVSD